MIGASKMHDDAPTQAPHIRPRKGLVERSGNNKIYPTPAQPELIGHQEEEQKLEVMSFNHDSTLAYQNNETIGAALDEFQFADHFRK